MPALSARWTGSAPSGPPAASSTRSYRNAPELFERDLGSRPAEVRGIGIPHEDECVGEPLGRERQRVARGLGAEDRRRNPARREPGVRRGDHEVLHGGAERQQRHAPLGPLAGGVGVSVEPVPGQAGQNERRRAQKLAVRRLDQLVDARRCNAIGPEVGAPPLAHPGRKVALGRVRVHDDEPPGS